MSSSERDKRGDSEKSDDVARDIELSDVLSDEGIGPTPVVDNERPVTRNPTGQTPFVEVTVASPETPAFFEEQRQDLEPHLQKISLACHLGFFGIIGVLIRYSLELLFGQSVGDVTDNNQVVFTDFPANMFGCFLMGIIGVRLKPELNRFSSLLTLGLTTGLMGSITTYASWNQRMLTFITNRLEVRGIFGLLLGMLVSQMSLLVGIDTGAGLKYAYESRPNWLRWKCYDWTETGAPDNYQRKRKFMILFTTVFGLSWVLALIASVADGHHATRRRLWLACVFGPFGVWTRYFLSLLNGRGCGPKKVLAWLPFGTIAANLIACYIEAGLNLASLLFAEEGFLLLSGALQLGLLGCMSTVSTFVNEVYQLHRGRQLGRAYVYATGSLFASSIGSLLIFSLPIWILGKRAVYNSGKRV